jgi:hypothetical protein
MQKVDRRSSLLDDYASKIDLAGEFGVSIRTVERWVRLRVIPSPVRIGRLSLFHVPSLAKYLAEQAQHPQRLMYTRRK